MAEQGGQTSFVKIYLSYITLHVVPLRVELMRQGVQLHTVCKGFYAAVRSEVQQPATAAAWLRAWRPDPALLPLLMQQAERGGRQDVAQILLQQSNWTWEQCSTQLGVWAGQGCLKLCRLLLGRQVGPADAQDSNA